MKKWLSFLGAAAIVSCGGGDNTRVAGDVFDDLIGDELTGTFVATGDGAIQCVRTELPPAETAQILLNAGVDVSRSYCAGDPDVSVLTVCGAPTGGLHLHRIPSASIADATAKGFVAVEDVNALVINECRDFEEHISTDDFNATSYQYTYETTGFSPLDGQWLITVEDAEVTQVRFAGEGEPDQGLTVETAPTIRTLLDQVDACTPSNECRISGLDYDQEHFFPRRFRRSWGEEGDGFIISAFERLD